MKKHTSLVLISLLAGCLILGGTTAARGGTVTGRMLMKTGEPIAGGTVIIFNSEAGPPPDPNQEIRPPDFTRELDNKGKFKLELPAGTYYFGAIKWQDGGPGPPESGDIFFIADKVVRVPGKGLVDLGDLAKGEFFQGVPDPQTQDNNAM